MIHNVEMLTTCSRQYMCTQWQVFFRLLNISCSLVYIWILMQYQPAELFHCLFDDI